MPADCQPHQHCLPGGRIAIASRPAIARGDSRAALGNWQQIIRTRCDATCSWYEAECAIAVTDFAHIDLPPKLSAARHLSKCSIDDVKQMDAVHC